MKLFASNCCEIAIELINHEENVFPMAHLPESHLASKDPAPTEPNGKRYDHCNLQQVQWPRCYIEEVNGSMAGPHIRRLGPDLVNPFERKADGGDESDEQDDEEF